jgi:hypothetical protein
MTILEICWILFSVLKEFACIQIELRETTVEAGKEDMLIPVDGQVADAWQLQQCPHQAEIQSIALSASQNDGGVLLGSVDSNGHLVVTCLDSTTGRGASYTTGPQDAGMGEGWWAGIVFSQSHLGLVCIWQSSGVCSSRLTIIA